MPSSEFVESSLSLPAFSGGRVCFCLVLFSAVNEKHMNEIGIILHMHIQYTCLVKAKHIN